MCEAQNCGATWLAPKDGRGSVLGCTDGTHAAATHGCDSHKAATKMTTKATALTKQIVNHGPMVLHPTGFIWLKHGLSWRSKDLVAIDKASRRRHATRIKMFDRVLQVLGVRPTERCKRACRYEYYCRLRDRINGEIDLCHAKQHRPSEHLRGLSMAAIDNLITKALAAFEQYGEISCRDMFKPSVSCYTCMVFILF